MNTSLLSRPTNISFSKILPLIFTGLFLIGCDPGQEIVIVNNSSSETRFQFDLESDMDSYMFDEYAEGNQIIFNLMPNDTITIPFGIGTWSENEIVSLANEIEKLIVENEDRVKIFKSKTAIKQLLRESREDSWMQAILLIKAE